MAEIILPPEENEETPQTPELNIDKPTENSKVITIEFEAKKTNKVSTKDTKQQLYTTDTDAWFEFKETSLEGANGTYSVVFRNRHDGSIFQRTGDVVNGVAYYKIPHQEIRHAGAWRGQVVYTLSNGDTTAREFDYDVKGHILDGKDVREIVVEDFETLMSQLRSMKDNAEVELANLTQELENTTDTAEQNETDRQAFFNDLVEDIDDLQANYQELLDTGVLQTNINTKLEQLEEEYAPKLTEVTAQLAHKVDEVILDESVIKFYADGNLVQNISVVEAGNSTAVQDYIETLVSNGQIEGLRIGERAVKPENTTFIEVASNNLFNKDDVLTNSWLSQTGNITNYPSGNLSHFIPVRQNEEYTILRGFRYAYYNSSQEFISLHGNDSPPNITITIPVGVHYIRIVVLHSYMDSERVNKGDELLPYDEYAVRLKGSSSPLDEFMTKKNESWVI